MKKTTQPKDPIQDQKQQLRHCQTRLRKINREGERALKDYQKAGKKFLKDRAKVEADYQRAERGYLVTSSRLANRAEKLRQRIGTLEGRLAS